MTCRMQSWNLGKDGVGLLAMWPYVGDIQLLSLRQQVGVIFIHVSERL